MKTFSPLPTTHRNLLAVIIAGLSLMVGIIFYRAEINTFLVTETTVIAKAAPSAPTPTTTPTDVATTTPNQNSIPLNDPRNFRVVPTNLKPAQAFIEGKTTKFLMGL